MGGHRAAPEHPERCGTCGAQLGNMKPPPVLASLLACGLGGCTFVANDPGELADHDAMTGHCGPLDRVRLLCAEMGGHEPSPGNPGTCGSCGATLEVLRG